ncbi:MAG: ADP-glyceromanno-heptose 6-epimerase [Bdellovibrionota bacterium]
MSIIVLTGAHGFIGTNLLEKILVSSPEELGLEKVATPKFSNFDNGLNAKNISTIITDLPESLNQNNARRFAGSARVKYVDYESLFQFLENLPEQPTLIIHNGACSSTVEQNPEVFAKLNLGYTQKVWAYCTKHKIPLIYASSAATYGDGTLGFSDKKEDCEKYTSLNLYGKSKLDFDIWALKQKETPPTWFGLRYFNVYGQFEGHKGGQASMVYHGYGQATRTGKIKLFKSNTSKYADGDQVRDFIYVDDIVAITLILARICIERKMGNSKLVLPDNGMFLNVGTGVTETWNNLAKNVFTALGLPANIEYITMPENIANQYQNYTCADLSSLRSIGVNHQFHTLEQGVTKYVQKHLVRGQ